MRIASYHVDVVQACRVTERMQRVTLGGDGLLGFVANGLGDERVRLLLPRSGQDRPALPTIDERGFSFPPGVPRPIARTLTLRRFDPDALELDVDVVVHDGAASTWAQNACPGAAAAIAGPAGGYEPAPDVERFLLAGDETALPAIATILRRLPARARADVLVELADPAARQPLDSEAVVDVTWLQRADEGGGSHDVLAGAVRTFDWPDEPVNVWAAAEALTVRAIRRHVRDERALPRERFDLCGHWRRRLTEDQAVETSETAQQTARAAGAGDDEIDDAGLY